MKGHQEVHTVLFDADGVLQWPASGWLEVWEPFAGGDLETFVADMFHAEKASLEGRERVHDGVTRYLAERGLDVGAVDEIVKAWAMIELFGESFELIAAIRAAGVRCHLATNQQSFRRDIMLDLGYADHFDELFFSCDLGVAKPDPRYFEAILDRLGHGPEGVVFIDDRLDNVEAARSVGIDAHPHDHHDSADQGVGDLRALLRRVGVPGV
ncbi:HAD family hydrolase [Mobilicoccus caccae]|uniref:Hydrolase of the HAD superfamily n=1 Tax=Mobilicoccus caccae TaxID=1859295 RepID=A0ABQ6IR80_9MICO|nr:HAD-IA family hydrolase [Mobilicoccus caccae]GMA39964.1 hypothetical protein GCM10025883_20090 [Mobilicoccus caccae]